MAIIVTDMLRGFLEPGYPLYCGESSRRIIEPVKMLLQEKEGKEAIIFIRDEHNENDPEFRVFPSHCIKGSDQSKVINELHYYWQRGIDVPKTRYSGFYDTDLNKILLQNVSKDEDVTVVGVCTDICVLYTCADLRNRDYNVIVPRNCVASFDEKAHEWALLHMRKILAVKITES